MKNNTETPEKQRHGYFSRGGVFAWKTVSLE